MRISDGDKKKVKNSDKKDSDSDKKNQIVIATASPDKFPKAVSKVRSW